MKTTETIRELHGRWKRAVQENGVAPELFSAFLGRSDELRLAIPAPTRVVEPPSSDTGHILFEDLFQRGRLVRERSQLLCGERRFTSLLLSDRPATCLECLELAERLASRGEG